MVVGLTLAVHVGTQLWRDPQGFEHDFRYWSKNQWNCVALCPVRIGFCVCIKLFVCIHTSAHLSVQQRLTCFEKLNSLFFQY